MLNKLYKSSIFTSWIAQGIKILFNLITLPIVLKEFTAEEANVWFLFFTIIGIGQGIQLGFNTTFVRFISYSFSGVRIKEFMKLKEKKEKKFLKTVDINEFSNIFVVLKKTFIAITLVYILVMGTLGTWSVFKPISYLQNFNEGWATWILILGSSAVALYFTIYQIYLLGVNKVSLVNRIITLGNLLGIIIVVLVSIYAAGLFSIFLVVQLITILNGVACFYMSKRVNGNFLQKLPKSSFRKDVFIVVWDSAWKSGTTTIVANIIKHISGVIVAQIFTPSVSATFLLTKRLFDILETFTQVTFQAKIPEVASLRGMGDFERLIPLLKKVLYVSYGVFLSGVVVILFLGQDILNLIKGNIELGGPILLIAFCFSSLVNRWGGINLAISNQANHIIEHISAIIVFFVYFLFIILFYKSLGMLVFPLAMLISGICTAPLIIKRVYKTLNTTFFKFEMKIFMPVLVALILISLIYFYSIQ